MDPITSTKNPLVARVRRLHRARHRRETGSVLLEGPTLVAEAVAAGHRPTLLLSTDPDRWVDAAERVVPVSPAVLEACATTDTPQDPLGVIDRPMLEPTGPRRLLAWQIADPGNLGTMIRTAAAVGVDVLVGGIGSADPWSPKCLRAGAGAHFLTGLTEVDGVDAFDAGGRSVALVVRDGAEPSPDPEGTWTLVVGSEAHGLPAEIVERCELMTLPMPGGTESLNAAVAASIALYSLAV